MVGAKMNACEAATGITSEFSEWFELAKAGLLKLSKRRQKKEANDSRPHGQWMEYFWMAGLWVSEEKSQSKMTL